MIEVLNNFTEEKKLTKPVIDKNCNSRIESQDHFKIFGNDKPAILEFILVEDVI